MTIKGKVIAAVYSGFEYAGKNGQIYRHDIQIQKSDGVVVYGVYDSISKEQTKMVVGQDIEVEVLEREKKNGQKYNKFKIVRERNFSGVSAKEDPITRAQIQRSSSLKRVPEIIRAFKVTRPDETIVPGALVKTLNAWVVAVGEGVRQKSINAQAALESATQMIEIENIQTVDQLLELAHKYYTYITGEEKNN